MPVITTHWGGLTDLVTDSTALLLRPTGLEPAFEDEPALINYDDQANHLWASVATEDVQKVMRYASNPSNKDIIRTLAFAFSPPAPARAASASDNTTLNTTRPLTRSLLHPVVSSVHNPRGFCVVWLRGGGTGGP